MNRSRRGIPARADPSDQGTRCSVCPDYCRDGPRDLPLTFLPLSKWIPACAGITLAFLAASAQAYDLRGHAKWQANQTELPGGSLLNEFADDPMRDTGIDLRLNYSDRRGGLSWRADYQLSAAQGDRLELSRRAGRLRARYRH